VITRRALLALWLASVLVTTGCQPRLEVSLASSDELLPQPRFEVRDPYRPAERPLYNTIKVLDASGRVIWHLRAEPFGEQASVAGFTYGEAPRGFSVVVAPDRLEPGREYTLRVIGKAYGSLRFRVDAGGRLQ